MAAQKYPSKSEHQIEVEAMGLYLKASDKSIKQGLSWYHRARKFLERIERDNGYFFTYAQLAGALSALSPRNTWARNCEDLVSLIENGTTRQTFANQTKAEGILMGEFGEDPHEIERAFSPITAPKTLNFFRNLMGDDQSVTVDTHIVAMFYGSYVNPVNCDRGYNMECGIQQAADKLELAPRELQAILWCSKLNGEFAQ